MPSGHDEAEGALLDDSGPRRPVPSRPAATTTFHVDEARRCRVPVVAMLVGSATDGHGSAGPPRGRGWGSVCASGAARTTSSDARAQHDRRLINLRAVEMTRSRSSSIARPTDPLSREAQASGLAERFANPERIRSWTYEFDPSGLELLRRSIEHVVANRRAAEAAHATEAAPV
jgi:hypothetical protein